jgi:hypothetical protein
MDSAVSYRQHLKLSRYASWRSALNVLSFLLLGGASLILLAVLMLLRSPSFIMSDNVRYLFQEAGTFTLLCVVLFSYPHFVFSYKFAYQQGFSFVKQHSWQLLGYPILIVLLLATVVATWNYPVAQVPVLLSVDRCLSNMSIKLNWSVYNGCGQMLLAGLLVLQTVMAGHHFCLQAFGVTLACGEDEGYRISTQQKKILRFNMYSLWVLNLFSGYTFFTLLNNKSFTYNPPQFPQSLVWLSYAVFAVSVVLLLTQIVLPIYKDQRKLPPALSLLPLVSVWIWLQPFCQPYGYQAWVVPLAHGAQYLYFAYRIEGNDFDPIFQKMKSKHTLQKTIYMLVLSVAAIALGYACFVQVPVLLDKARILPTVAPNFFLLAAFIFINTHHYLIDGVVWSKDSRAKKLLHAS